MGIWVSGLNGCAASPTRIDVDEETGYAIYRTGRLDTVQLERLCDLGVEEMVVMDGSAQEHECQMRTEVCPSLEIRYDRAQDPRVPVRRDFLVAFDDWVEESKRAGRQIAIRCRHGWHRTGRLSAYYRMRFQEWGRAAAIDEMMQVGNLMWRYRELRPQVEAIADLLATGSCAQGSVYCPQATPASEEPSALAGDGRFAADVCDTDPGREDP